MTYARLCAFAVRVRTLLQGLERRTHRNQTRLVHLYGALLLFSFIMSILLKTFVELRISGTHSVEG